MDVEEQGRAVSVFGSKVFRDLLHHGATHNVVLSPLALGMALMAATAGASGETKKELLDMFQITTLDLESCQSLIRGTTKSHSVLDIATSLWFDKSYELKKEFVTTCEENFYTTVKNLSDAEDINRWVTSATHGKLRRVIDPLPQSQPLTVVNCVYFHGTWKKEFTTDPNLKIKFTGFDGTTKESEAMKVTSSLPYIKNDLYQAVEIPYCDRFVATVIVPEREGEREIQDIVDRLREFTSWRKFTEQLSSQSITVSLPQFKIEWQNYHLEEACKDLGLRTCFSSVASTFADASVNHEGLYISQILHRTLIEVGARGMETTTLSDPDSATSLVVDRPFIFVISDTKSGSVLVSSVVDQFSRFSDDDVDGSGQTTTTTNVEMSETKTRREGSRSPRRKSRSRSRSRSPRRRSPSPRRRRSRSRSPARSYRSRSRTRSTSPSRRRSSRSPRRGGRYRSRSPRRYRSPRGRRNRSPSPRRPRETTCLFVRNFSSSVTKRELTDLFSSCGDLKNVYIAVNKERAPYAFVTFYDRLDAEDAMDKYKGYDLDGKKLCLDWDVGIENKRKKSNSNYVKY